MRELLRGIKTPHLASLLAASLCINILGLALPILMMQIYNRVLPNEAKETLFMLSIAVIIAASADLLLKMARHRILSANSKNYEDSISLLLAKRLTNSKFSAYENYSPVRMAQDIQSAGRLKDDYSGIRIITILLDVPFIFALLVLLYWLGGKITFVPLVILSFFAIWLYRHGEALHDVLYESEKIDDRRYDFVTTALNAIHSIKANCLEAITTRKFEALQNRAARINYSAPYLHGHVDILNASIAQIMTIALIAVGAPMVVEQSITIGTLIAVILVAGQIVQPFQRAMTLWLRQRDALTAACRLERIFALSQRSEGNERINEFKKSILKIDSLDFCNSGSFGLFSGLQIEIPHGSTVAIHGSSGSGKTTLLELLCGLQEPQKGTVKYGDINLCQMPEFLRSKLIAYLPMNGFILRGSIMENLTCFDPRQQLAARDISKLLGIDSAVARLPQGYDTFITGQGSQNISPGLCQRISIARALLHKPQILLFDNANHGLDKESYALVFNLLKKIRGEVTLIIVSEDRNITSLADQDYILSEGNLKPMPNKSEEQIIGIKS